MKWDEYYKQFSKARRSPRPMEVIEQFIPMALEAMSSISAEDTEWLIKGLRDSRKKWFVQLLCARSDTLLMIFLCLWFGQQFTKMTQVTTVIL